MTIVNDLTTDGRGRETGGTVRVPVGTARGIVGVARECSSSRRGNGNAQAMWRRAVPRIEAGAIVEVSTGRRIVVCLRTCGEKENLDTSVKRRQSHFRIQNLELRTVKSNVNVKG